LGCSVLAGCYLPITNGLGPHIKSEIKQIIHSLTPESKEISHPFVCVRMQVGRGGLGMVIA
jgi:hypothetical protein